MKPLAIALAAALAAPALAAEPPSGADGYAVSTRGSTQALEVGETGKLVLAIEPRAPWHVDPRAPLKIRLEPSAGLKLAKTSLARKDLVDPKAEMPRFETPFTAGSAGAQQCLAHLDFFLCRDTICARQTRTVVLPVAVK